MAKTLTLVTRAGEVDRGPHYKLNTSKGHTKISHDKNENKLSYASGPLHLGVNAAPNELGFVFSSPNGKKLTGHSRRSIGYVGDQKADKYRFEDGIYAERQGYMLAELDLGVGEKVYGLGERFGPLVKNGQTVDIWNEDGGTSSELAYKNIPFYISSKGYGVFVNHPGKVSLEVQSVRTTRVNISVPGEEIEYFVVYGATPKEILKRYTDLTGKPGLVPSWSYNLWLTTSELVFFFLFVNLTFIIRFHHELRRGNSHRLPGWLPRQRYPTGRLSLRLFLDEIVPMVRL
jgi:alpha-D-xyloside xylohydrolase